MGMTSSFVRALRHALGVHLHRLAARRVTIFRRRQLQNVTVEVEDEELGPAESRVARVPAAVPAVLGELPLVGVDRFFDGGENGQWRRRGWATATW